MCISGSPETEIRSIVGLWGNTTEPSALDALDTIGELRLVKKPIRFHIKLYIFRCTTKSVAWIGSGNFTFGGFGGNEELFRETSTVTQLHSWFNTLWERCGPIPDDAIAQYREWRKSNPPRQPSQLNPVEATPEISNVPFTLLQEVNSWATYLGALRQSDHWWRFHHNWSVFGEHNSWFHTIFVLRNLESLLQNS